jgi:hypothetical protein
MLMNTNLKETYSKWEMNEQTGARYRTVSLCAPNFKYVFAVEVMELGRRKTFVPGNAELAGALTEHKRISAITEKEKTFVSRVQYESDIHTKEEMP